MKNRIKLHHVIILSTIISGVSILSSNAEVISWQASSGLTPDQVGFELVDSSSPENPVLNNSVLTISNDSSSERMFYGTREPSTPLLFPTVFEASFQMKYISSTSSFNGRRAAGVFVTTSANSGSNLYIGNDTIFLSQNMNTQGPAASVDTNDSFHDYLLRIDGNAVSVFQDGNLVLSGNTINDVNEIGSSPRVLFGDVTSLASGTSEWSSFSHNAAIPEPSSIILLSFSGFIIFKARRVFFR